MLRKSQDFHFEVLETSKTDSRAKGSRKHVAIILRNFEVRTSFQHKVPKLGLKCDALAFFYDIADFVSARNPGLRIPQDDSRMFF